MQSPWRWLYRTLLCLSFLFTPCLQFWEHLTSFPLIIFLHLNFEISIFVLLTTSLSLCSLVFWQPEASALVSFSEMTQGHKQYSLMAYVLLCPLCLKVVKTLNPSYLFTSFPFLFLPSSPAIIDYCIFHVFFFNGGYNVFPVFSLCLLWSESQRMCSFSLRARSRYLCRRSAATFAEAGAVFLWCYMDTAGRGAPNLEIVLGPTQPAESSGKLILCENEPQKDDGNKIPGKDKMYYWE